MSAFWPTSVATDANLYVAKNSLQTTLATGLGTGDTSVVLASSTGFPTAGGVTIDNEVIFYTGISGATLTGCTRGADGTTAATHSVGVPVGASIIAFHHNGLMAEIEAIESYLNTVLGKSTTVTSTEFGYLSGVTSAIQTQFTNKLSLSGGTMSGNIAMGSNKLTGLAAGSSNGDSLRYEQLIGAYLALTGGTMSGAIAMGTNKITGLGNGTAAQDAAAFGQLIVLQAPVFSTSTTPFSTTSATFQTTNSSASITPTSASSRILVIATGQLRSARLDNSGVYASLFRGSTNLGGGSGNNLGQLLGPVSGTVVQNFNVGQCMCYIDSPATTSSTTYSVKIANADGATNVVWGNEGKTNIILVEIV